MTAKPETEKITLAGAPAVLKASSWIWLALAAAGTIWTLAGLLMILAFGGMVQPETYLPALALYLASAAVFVTGGVMSVLLRRGRRPARAVLSAYAVIIPAFFYFRGGAFAGGVPWQQALLSPVGAVVVATVAATVLMWLPSANAYFARSGTRTVQTPAGPGASSNQVPRAVAASVWILVVAGVVAALQSVLGLLLLAGNIGTGANAVPALVLWLTLAAVAAADLAGARAVRQGKAFVRPVVTAIPPVGLALLVLATAAGFASMSAEGPAAGGGLLSAVTLTVLTQGLPLLGGLVPAVLVWVPSAGQYFRRGAGDRPAGATES